MSFKKGLKTALAACVLSSVPLVSSAFAVGLSDSRFDAIRENIIGSVAEYTHRCRLDLDFAHEDLEKDVFTFTDPILFHTPEDSDTSTFISDMTGCYRSYVRRVLSRDIMAEIGSDGDTIFHFLAKYRVRCGNTKDLKNIMGIFESLICTMSKRELKNDMGAIGKIVDRCNKSGKTPIDIAFENGDFELLNFFVVSNTVKDGKSNVLTDAFWSKYGNVLLHWAALGRRHDLIGEVTKSPVKYDINFADANGRTPLHQAAISGDFQTVGKLLKNSFTVVNPREYKYLATPLNLAVYYSRLEAVKALLKRSDIDVNIPNRSGCTPLHFAADKGNLSIGRELLKNANIQVNAVDNRGRTPLYYAVRGGHFDFVKMLLSHPGIDTNIVDANGYTVFDYVAQEESSKLLKLRSEDKDGFMENMIGISDQDISESNLPVDFSIGFLHEATRAAMVKDCQSVTRSLDMMKLLLGSPSIRRQVVKLDEFGNTMLHDALARKDYYILNLLASFEDIDVNCLDRSGKTIVHNAVGLGDVDSLECLRRYRNINFNTWDNNERTPLHCAVLSNDLGMARHLLRSGRVDPNFEDGEGNTPLQVAIMNDNKEILKVLLGNPRVNINFCNPKNGKTAFHLALDKGDIEIIDLLLCHPKFNYGFVDSERNTPLQLAVKKGRTDIVAHIMSPSFSKTDYRLTGSCLDMVRGYDEHSGFFTDDLYHRLMDSAEDDINIRVKPNLVDERGRTVLHHAVLSNNAKMVECLLNDPRVQIGLADSINCTPLHYAALSGYEDVLEKLLGDYRINECINAINSHGNTPLHYAVKNGNLKMVGLLMKNSNIDVNITNSVEYYTPIQCAAAAGNLDMVKLLLSNPNTGIENCSRAIQIAVNNHHYEIARYIAHEKQLPLPNPIEITVSFPEIKRVKTEPI